MGTEKSIEQTTAEREAYDRDPAGYLASHEMTHGLKIHIMRGEAKLTHAAEKAHLEAELAAMTEKCEALAALTRALESESGYNLFGTDEQRSAAFADVVKARTALTKLGININA